MPPPPTSSSTYYFVVSLIMTSFILMNFGFLFGITPMMKIGAFVFIFGLLGHRLFFGSFFAPPNRKIPTKNSYIYQPTTSPFDLESRSVE